MLLAGSLDPRGPVAESISDLWWLMFGLGVVVFAIVVTLLLGGLFRRRTEGDESGEDIAPRPDRTRRWLLGGGVLMPTLVIVVVLAATVEAMRDVPTRAPDGALVVEIVGHQWWWEVRYPEDDVVTANELHLPVDRPVSIALTSADVIHSFWVPELAGKLDLLPDGVNTLVLQADEAGRYRSDCAEFCGLQHANMSIDVVAEPTDEFEAWLDDQRRPAVEPAGVEARRGRDEFVTSECATCHTVRGTTADGDEGPDLTHVASRPTLGAGVVENTPENVAAWVTDPHAVKDGVLMPAADLTEQQRDDLLAYLDGLG